MKVLHVVGSLDSSHGGPSRSVPNLAAALSKRSIEGIILHTGSSSRQAPEADVAVRADVEIVRIPGIRQAVRWAAAACQRGVDVVHLHGIWSLMLHRVHRAAIRSSVPVVISPRGMLEPWARNHHAWRKRLAWSAFQRADLNMAHVLHATSQEEARNLQFLRLTPPVKVIPNGTAIPSAPALFEGDRRILFLSRYHPVKGPMKLVESVAALQNELRLSGWKIIMAGPDEDGYESVIRSAVRTAGVEDLFEFMGEVQGEEKWRLLRSAQIFVLPSSSENFGIVVAEALASGLPVITTKATPWSDLLKYDCGWWVDPSTPAVAEAIHEATAMTAAELRILGARGRKLVESKYSWSSIAARFEDLYSRDISNS